MGAEEGLRERKRRETRALIAGTAMRLFMRRGFDAVNVAEIAAAAGVAEKTVYNYFGQSRNVLRRGRQRAR